MKLAEKLLHRKEVNESHAVTTIASENLSDIATELLMDMGNREIVNKVGLGKMKSTKDGMLFKESIFYDKDQNIIGYFDLEFSIYIDRKGIGIGLKAKASEA